MPERGEVFLSSEDFADIFPIGSQIIRVDSLDPEFNPGPLVPKESFPLTVKLISSKGKKTFINFTNGMNILVSYGMTGSFRITRYKFAKYKFVGPSDETIYWQCSRKLHCEKIEYLTKKELGVELGKLGLDVYSCTSTPTDDEILNCYLSARKKSFTQNISNFLMNQKRFCGIGNYLRCMILYRLKISPYRKVCDLTKEEKIAIYRTANDIVNQVISIGGHTVFDWKRSNEQKLAKFDVTPYSRIKDDYGNDIVKDKVSTNSKQHIYWCPAIQK